MPLSGERFDSVAERQLQKHHAPICLDITPIERERFLKIGLSTRPVVLIKSQ